MDMERIVNAREAEAEKQVEVKTEAGKEATVVSDDVQVREFSLVKSKPENYLQPAKIEEIVPDTAGEELPLADELKNEVINVVDETDHSSLNKDQDFTKEATDVKELPLDTKGAEDVEDSEGDVKVHIGAEYIEDSNGKSKVGDQEREVVHSNGNGNVAKVENGLSNGEDQETVDNGLQTAGLYRADTEEEKAVDNRDNTSDTEEEKLVDNKDNRDDPEEKEVSDDVEEAVENGLNRGDRETQELAIHNGLDKADAEEAVETGLQNGLNERESEEASADDVEEKPVIEAAKDETEQLTDDVVSRDSLDKDKVDKGFPAASCPLISRAKTGVKNFGSWCLQLDNDNFDFHSWASGFALGTVLACSAVVVSNKYYAGSR